MLHADSLNGYSGVAHFLDLGFLGKFFLASLNCSQAEISFAFSHGVFFLHLVFLRIVSSAASIWALASAL